MCESGCYCERKIMHAPFLCKHFMSFTECKPHLQYSATKTVFFYFNSPAMFCSNAASGQTKLKTANLKWAAGKKQLSVTSYRHHFILASLYKFHIFIWIVNLISMRVLSNATKVIQKPKVTIVRDTT